MKKTNAIRILERHKISYSTVEYQVDESDLTAVHVAESLNQNIEAVFKTIVLEGDKTGYLVACIPGSAEVNLKNLAAASGNKKCATLPMKNLLPTTGYIRGGCSPLGMKKQFPTYFHQSALEQEHIFISAGVRGIQIQVNPNDLIKLIGASTADLI